MLEEDRDWTAFASNVGKARMQRRDAVEVRLRWAGAILLLFVVAVGACFMVRYYGMRVGWWNTLVPMKEFRASVHAFFAHVHSWVSH
jgi:hypothetical protein